MGNPVRVASSCANSYDLAPGESINISLAANGDTFWIAPKTDDWNCSTPCSQCFYFFMLALDERSVQVGVGNGMDSEQVNLSLQEQTSDKDNITCVAGVQLWTDASDESISCTSDDCDRNPLVITNEHSVSLQILGDDLETQNFAENENLAINSLQDSLGALGVANATLNETVDEAFESLNKSLLQNLSEYDPDAYETSIAASLAADTEFQQVMRNLSNDFAEALEYVELGSASSSSSSSSDPILNALNGLLRQKLSKINGLAGAAIKDPYPFPVHVDRAQMQYVTGLRSIKVSSITATKLDIGRGILYLNLNGYFRKFITAVGEIDIIHSRVKVLLGPHVSWTANGIKAYVDIAKKSVKRFQVGHVGVHIRGILGQGYFPGNPTRPDGLITSAVNKRLPKYYGFINGAFRQQFKKTLQSTLNRFKSQFSFR